jgi:two-component system sensor histidine kinase KdpD
LTAWISYKASKTQQYLISILLIAVVAAICFSLSLYIGYHVVALILLVTVSFIAMFFDILPVLLAAFLSALIWNIFFIPPRFSLSVATTEDALFLAMYFVIAFVNAALTFKIRQIEKKEVKKEQKENTLKLYNTLLNSLSHELRTPISTIMVQQII